MNGQKRLLPRELVAWKLIAQGHTTKSIAAELKTTEQAAMSVRKNLYTKLGLNSIALVTILAIQQGIIVIEMPKNKS